VSIKTLTQEDPIGLAGGLNLYGFAGGDPINFSDPFGLSPWGKIIKLGVRGFKTLMKRVPEDAMVRAVREGDDVIAGSRQAARRIAREAGEGADPIGPELHRGAGNRSHYHPAGRSGGHVFYSIAAGLTVSHYVGENAPGIVKAAAAVLDFFNPLGTPNDILQVIDEVKSMSTQPNQPDSEEREENEP